MNKLIKSLLKTKTDFLKTWGLSMSPLLKSDDIIYFKKTNFSRLKINDIILVKKGGKLFTHRIIYKNNKYLITKGDNNLESDGKIYPKQIVGKVYQVKRNGKIFDPENLYLVQSSLYFQETIKIKNAFEKENIDHVFLKGLPLHLYYEKTQPKKIYADCDVLIDKKSFLKAEKILIQNGYKKTKTNLSKTHDQIKNKEVENAYIKIINGFRVVFDLHLEPAFMMTQLGKLEVLYPQKLIDQLTEKLLKTKRKVKINNEKFLILNTNYLILYLSLHLFHHNFRGAFRYDFLDKVIRISARQKPAADLRGQLWIGIAAQIYKFKLQTFVYPVFILLKKYYQTPVPNSFLKSIRPINPLIRELVNKIIKNCSIFDDELRIQAGIIRFKNLFFLSPQPLWKKVFIFINPQVIYSVFWVVYNRLFRRK